MRSREGRTELTAVPVPPPKVLPSSISLKSAAGLIVQGLTALTQLRESYAVKKHDYILVHAGASLVMSVRFRADAEQ